ncbi:hypothetical protein [Ramlibacter rhizophilus]|uniref:Uncharacterized protein n=1 Tax=Ramlibacter rhizophilus TaxID=1781167 RepID=A0A4Z0BKY3_9BURK|nr:hypothetical protein [Ramlibacter rhizophilus]TFY99982.1 hypothetical protein EZ242_12705 [Ramlibacter rhizophilus]
MNASSFFPAPLGRAHARRLRELYRSAGWPCQDTVELELLAAGMLERLRDAHGRETLRLTDAGIGFAAAQAQRNRAALSLHESLVDLVAQHMMRAGRVVWTGLSLRAQVPADAAGEASSQAAGLRWCVARPDVFSIRHTSVEAYVEPVVHEIKVRRADLLADLRQPGKRAAYQDLGACWYVIGLDPGGRPIAEPEEIPAECGVLLARGTQLECLRPAPPRPRSTLPFGVWMALAKATPLAPEPLLGAQAQLRDDAPPAEPPEPPPVSA